MSQRLHGMHQIPEEQKPSLKEEHYTKDDLGFPELRQSLWDQIHPCTWRYRPQRYKESSRWTVENERFIARQQEQDWRTWIGGIYAVSLSWPGDLTRKFLLTLELNFGPTQDEKDCVKWTIDIPKMDDASDIAYPGTHQGAILIQSPRTFYEIIWITPIFSPYVVVTNPDRGEDENIKAVFGKSKSVTDGQFVDTIHEVVHFGNQSETVLVVQELLKDLAFLLINGPRYTKMTQIPRVELEEEKSYVDERCTSFYQTDRFPEVAKFFSRAYCERESGATGDKIITEQERESTIRAIEWTLEYFQILQEPHWVWGSEIDWVESLKSGVRDLKSFKQLREFENKWATLTSYSCALHLHEGPWAGQDWGLHVATRRWG